MKETLLSGLEASVPLRVLFSGSEGLVFSGPSIASLNEEFLV